MFQVLAQFEGTRVPSSRPKWAGSLVLSSGSKCAGSPLLPILQYFQIHGPFQNGWSFSVSRLTRSIRMVDPSVFGWSCSISRFTGHIRMLGPSVFPDSWVIPEWLVLQYFQIHRPKNQVWGFKMDFSGLNSSPKGLLF